MLECGLTLYWCVNSPAVRMAPVHLEVLCIRELTKWSSVNRLPSCSSLPPRVAHNLLAALAEAKQLHPKTLTAFLKWYVAEREKRGRQKSVACIMYDDLLSPPCVRVAQFRGLP